MLTRLRAETQSEGISSIEEAGEWKGSACFMFSAEKTAVARWVGLLARRVRIDDSLVASPSPALNAEWYSKRGALTHSGGTAPDLHRTSPLCPLWAPKGVSVVLPHRRLVKTPFLDTTCNRLVECFSLRRFA